MFGSYLLAAYDADSEEYQTISKIGTGFRWVRVLCVLCCACGRCAGAGSRQHHAAQGRAPAARPRWPTRRSRARTRAACHTRSEEQLKTLAEQMEALAIPEPRKYYRWGCGVCAVWAGLVAAGRSSRGCIGVRRPALLRRRRAALASGRQALASHPPPTLTTHGRRYGETQPPDVWFDAKVVWEVKCADMSIR